MSIDGPYANYESRLLGEAEIPALNRVHAASGIRCSCPDGDHDNQPSAQNRRDNRRVLSPAGKHRTVTQPPAVAGATRRGVGRDEPGRRTG